VTEKGEIVSWELEGVTNGLVTFSSECRLIIDENETAAWLTIKATAKDNPEKYGTAKIRVVRSKYYVGNNDGAGKKDGSKARPFATVKDALAKLTETEDGQYDKYWPGKGTNDVEPANIVIMGKVQSDPINDDDDINNINVIDDRYPPIILSGEDNEAELKL
jgi:hypothetical protein